MATPSEENVNISRLLFDPQNPRIPTNVNGNNEREIINWLLDDGGLIELVLSIGTQGYFGGEPLLVIPNGNNFTVVEGNRRLAALKLLNDPNLASTRKYAVAEAVSEAKVAVEQVPVKIYSNREDVLEYLGFRHVTGIKEWGPLEKARYLRQLIQSPHYNQLSDNEKYKQVAKVIGSRADYVQKLLAGLSLYNKIENNDFFRLKGVNEETISFSLLTTALGYSNIVEFLGLEDAQDIKQENVKTGNLEDLTTWIFEENNEGQTRLGESRNLKTLNAVVGNETALSYFRDKSYSLEAAKVFTDEPLETYRNLVAEAREKLATALSVLTSVMAISETDVEVITELFAQVRDMRNVLKGRLDSDDLQVK